MNRLAAVSFSLALAACGASPVALNACPPVAQYTQAQQNQVLQELQRLPQGSMTEQFLNDYHRERVELLACQAK